jgi:hypothetical protein
MGIAHLYYQGAWRIPGGMLTEVEGDTFMPQRPDTAERRPPERFASRLSRMRFLSRLLDEQFHIPGTRYRVGLDGLLGLLPGVGDTLGTLLSAYMLYEAIQLGVPRGMLLRMVANVGLDTVIGVIPVVGDVFDIAWKANKKNMALINDYLAQEHAYRTPDEPARPAGRAAE